MLEPATRTECDCLNDCGDDRRLDDGRVEPCEYRKRRLALREQQVRDLQVARYLIASLREGDTEAQRVADAMQRLIDRVQPTYL